MTAQDDIAAAAGPFVTTPGGVEWRRDGYLVATDPALVDFALTSAVLARTYWAAGIPERVVRRSVEGSLAFAMYEVDAAGVGIGAGGTRAHAGTGAHAGMGAHAGTDGLTQIGFARVITDRAVFAWIGDVFVVESHRGRGLGLWLMQCVMAHPDLQGMRRWMLSSTSARGLYAKLGFTQLTNPELYMEIHDPDIHRRQG